MYSQQTAFLADSQDSFLPSTELCDGFLGYPADIVTEPTPAWPHGDRCRYDFRKAAAQSFFDTKLTEQVKDRANVAGLFVDNGFSVPCDGHGEYSAMSEVERQDFQEQQIDTYVRSFKKLADAGKYGILSSTNQFSEVSHKVIPWENQCPLGEESTVRAFRTAGVPYARNNEFWMQNMGKTCAA